MRVAAPHGFPRPPKSLHFRRLRDGPRGVASKTHSGATPAWGRRKDGRPFLARAPAPIGFVSWDLDYYSSTIAAFQLLEAAADVLLPRIVSYFDDIMGLTFGDHVGERTAITEFNATHLARKVSPIYGLRFTLPWPVSESQWSEMMYLAHLFDHPRFGDADGLIRSAEAPL